jgi:hypothetical protein
MTRDTDSPYPASVASAIPSPGEADHDPYRNSQDIMHMKSVRLDKELSATAHIPKRPTIIKSPSSKTAHMSDVSTSSGQDSGRAQLHTAQQVDSGLASIGQRPTTQQNVLGTSTGPVRPPRFPRGLWQ